MFSENTVEVISTQELRNQFVSRSVRMINTPTSIGQIVIVNADRCNILIQDRQSGKDILRVVDWSIDDVQYIIAQFGQMLKQFESIMANSTAIEINLDSVNRVGRPVKDVSIN
ncbi:MAG: hypothetical protein OHK0017_08200 [Patescibacteria group bacterium]